MFKHRGEISGYDRRPTITEVREMPKSVPVVPSLKK
jgi:hypothetical protein